MFFFSISKKTGKLSTSNDFYTFIFYCTYVLNKIKDGTAIFTAHLLWGCYIPVDKISLLSLCDRRNKSNHVYFVTIM